MRRGPRINARKEEGQALIIVALALMALLGILALVVDIGLAYAERRLMQNAADAAAEAGAREIILHSESRNGADAYVLAAVDKYAQANGAVLDYDANPPYYIDASREIICPVGASSDIPADAVGVRVQTSQRLTTFFAGVLGHDTMDVGAQSFAAGGCSRMPNGFQGLVPVSCPKEDFLKGGVYTLWDSQYWKDYGYLDLPANFKGLLNFDAVEGDGYVSVPAGNSKPQNIADWTRNGYGGTLAIGNTVEIINGTYGANVKKSLEDRFGFESHTDAGGEYIIVTIPLWDAFYSDNKPDRVRIWGFAAFKIYRNDIGSHEIKGHFVSYIVPGGEPATGTTDCLSWGPQTARLIPSAGGAPSTPAAPTAGPTTPPGPTATPGVPPGPTSTPASTATPAPTGTPCPQATVSGVSFNPVGKSGKVNVSWKTSIAANSTISWSSSAGGSGGSASGGGGTSHSVQITGIAKDVPYNYVITSVTACGSTTTHTGTFQR